MLNRLGSGLKYFGYLSLLALILSIAPARVLATTYYLAPAAGGGSDANNGTSAGTPWLTPNHALSCGDVIAAAASTSYASGNFQNFGAVSCPSGNNVAWLKCATFDACKISTSGQSGMTVNQSYWGVQGWEVTTSGNNAVCFTAYPSSGNIHHIIFANNVANGCGAGGISTFNAGSNGEDYLIIVGNIAYNAASSSVHCYSGISIYQPVQTDTVPGTHMYVAGNFSWNNVEPNPCNGTAPTDGEGIIFDSFDGSQGGIATYSQQAVAANNILLSNGGKGLEAYQSVVGSAHAPIYFVRNTVWGNNKDTNESGTWCGEVDIAVAYNVTAYGNLAVTNSATGCGSNPDYAFYVAQGDGSNSVHDNWGYSASGYNNGLNSSGSFAYGSGNTWGTDPSLASPAIPGAPNCSGFASVPACMATVIANFKPRNVSAQAYGYQPPLTTSASDALFPSWVCNVNLPAGLITKSCGTSQLAPPTGLVVLNVQ